MAQAPPAGYNRFMTERRYRDEEVREIFSLATSGDSADATLPVESGGLTLADLKQIGRQTGIDPARIADAAAGLEARSEPVEVKRSLGLPIALSRVVDLPRAPTDREWEQLISQFRTTFGAQGIATSSGGLRDWSSGDFHISVEPTIHGQQLRISAVKSDAQVANAFGVLIGGMTALITAAVIAAGKAEKAWAVVIIFGGMSLAAFVSNLIKSPRWAREGELQIQKIGENAVKLLSRDGASTSLE